MLSLTDEWFSPGDRFPQRSDCQDVTVPPQIRVRWGVRFLLLFSLAGFCTFTYGPRILHLFVRTTHQYRLLSTSLFGNYLSDSVFPCPFCLLWTLLQEAYPLKHSCHRNIDFTETYNLINLHPSYVRARRLRHNGSTDIQIYVLSMVWCSTCFSQCS